MNGKQSVFHNERKKWEPVNRQAAQVFRRATWEQMPPSEPRYLPSPEEQAAALAKAAADRVAILQEQCDEIDRKRGIAPKPQKQPKTAKCYQHAKNSLRAIHKRKGLPKPTCEEVRAYAKTLPGYGQPI